MNKRAITKPIAIGSLTKEQLDAELQKGMDDIAAGRVIPAEQVEAEMRKLYEKEKEYLLTTMNSK